MTPVLIVAALAALYLMMQKQNQAMMALIARGGSTSGSAPRGPSLDQAFALGSGGLSPEQQGLAVGAEAAGMFGSLASSGALGAGLQASKAIPIIGSVIGIATSILGGIFAAHAKKVKEEAQTLDNAVPRWRYLMQQINSSYNSGDVNTSDAIDYVARAKAMYYEQVKTIEHGDPGAGAPPSGYFGYTNSHPGTPPIDPCNGACYIGYYWIEPEAQIMAAAMRQADQTRKPVKVDFKGFTVRNGLLQAPLSLTFYRQ